MIGSLRFNKIVAVFLCLLGAFCTGFFGFQGYVIIAGVFALPSVFGYICYRRLYEYERQKVKR